MAPLLLPKESPIEPINNNWKTTKQLEAERKKREKLNRSNLQKRLKRAQQPGAGLGGRAYGLLNRKNGMLSKSDPSIEKRARTPRQKSVTCVSDVSGNQCQSNNIEMENQVYISDDFNMAEGEEAVRAFRIDILQERLRKFCEENVIAKQLLQGQAEQEKKKNHEKWSERQKDIDNSCDRFQS